MSFNTSLGYGAKKKVKDIIKELSINDLKIREFSRIKIGE